MPKALGRFTISKADEDSYLLHIEDEDGDTLELTATYDQLDLISESIDNRLDLDEDEGLDVDGDDNDDDNEQ